MAKTTVSPRLSLLLLVLIGLFAALPQTAWASGDLSAEGRLEPSASVSAQSAEIKDGLYVLRLTAAPNQVVSVKNSSLDAGANVIVAKRKGLNSQTFAIHHMGDGYYRICSPLSTMALGVEQSALAAGANVRMDPYKASASQLWRAEQLDGGAIRFVNKASGMALAVESQAAGANVRQEKAVDLAAPGFASAKVELQGFNLVKTKINLRDRKSYVQVAEKASSSGKVKISNKMYGYTVNKKKWKELNAAVRSCGFSLGFIMIDCNTGMTVSRSPNKKFYGASTIKGLYTTYLFEDKLETGALSRGRIAWLVHPTIVWSDNGAYLSLRARYGSQAGFNRWLRQVDVEPLRTWPSYSPQTLVKAWVNMLAYSNSKGKHVSYWKRTFNHSYMSSIHGALGKRRTTYSKPGWMDGGSYGAKLNDGGVVNDRHGRQYVLAIMTSAYPYSQKHKVERIVRALDAIHMDMPKTR